MSEFRIKVDNGKYEFIQRGGWKLDVLRHGQPWIEDLDGPKAIHGLMAELDAARVVLQAARSLVDLMANLPTAVINMLAKHDEFVDLTRAVGLHGRLCDDREPPSPWALPSGI